MADHLAVAVGVVVGVRIGICVANSTTLKVVTKDTRYVLKDLTNVIVSIHTCPTLIHLGNDISYSIAHADTPGVLTDGHEFVTTYQSGAALEHCPIPKYPTYDQVQTLIRLCTMAEPSGGVPPPVTAADMFAAVSGDIDVQKLVDEVGVNADRPDISVDVYPLLRRCLGLSEADDGDGFISDHDGSQTCPRD